MMSACVHRATNMSREEKAAFPERCLSGLQDMDGGMNASSMELSNNDLMAPSFPEELLRVNMTNLIAYSVLFPMAAVGNLLVLNSLFNNRRCKSRINLMILNLSFADMIVTFVFLPVEVIWNLTIQWPFGELGCKVYKFFSAFGFYTSSMILHGGRMHLRRSNLSSLERARTRTLRMTFIIVIAFIWCWTPYALGTMWNFIDKSSFENMNKSLQDMIFLLAVSNSVVNPLVYGRYIIPCCRHIGPRKPRPRRHSLQLQRNSSLGCNDAITRESSPPLGNGTIAAMVCT
ncbi:hypothetical protein HAZT_HAZT005172 [Hyalella azteca]|uniref:G-protein coupled receptors family 1 profile domain-containing protein n=1 Tax=Hyalella azteca TaxID=294128 RepID=A0A6A0HFZ1_HYAAZ|nr:hypothetical protein HAZT_HAZT005172 [Hyalella azteca]